MYAKAHIRICSSLCSSLCMFVLGCAVLMVLTRYIYIPGPGSFTRHMDQRYKNHKVGE
jgi:hypothetical protein